jgi:hypothetical protein
MNEYYVEKLRTRATLLLSNGSRVTGYFFLNEGSAMHSGPERVGDYLNASTGFFPFEAPTVGGSTVAIYNRAHIVMARLEEAEAEERQDPAVSLAKRKMVRLLLDTGKWVRGKLRIAMPETHQRLSDFAQTGERFRYVEADDAAVCVVNFDHVIEIVPEAE